MKGLVLVMFAVPEEARPFRRKVLRGADVQVVVTGIGQAKARAVARVELEARSPSLVLTCGFAGGLDPALRRGAVLIEADETFLLRPHLLRAGAVPGRFHCADRILITPAEKAEARQRTGADAVEMESAVIRALCRERGVPAATVRVVSDAANESLPLDFNRLSTAEGELSYRKLGWALAKSPRKVIELMQFQRALAGAADELARVLCAALRSATTPDRGSCG